MRAPLVLIALALALPRIASANTSVGVLVTGEYLKGPTQQQAEKWLRGRQQRVVTTPMPTDAVKILLDCFVLDDPKCMRSIVDARSTTDSLVSIRIDVASKKQREFRVTIDWFAKGHSPVTSRRTCDKCTEEVLRDTIDAMLEDLAKTAPGFNGQLVIKSTPPGLMVLLDNETIGVTPLERSVPVGSHTLRLVRDGRMGPEKTIDVEATQSPVDVALEPPSATQSGEAPRAPMPVWRHGAAANPQPVNATRADSGPSGRERWRWGSTYGWATLTGDVWRTNCLRRRRSQSAAASG